jgi:hypothetical protein
MSPIYVPSPCAVSSTYRYEDNMRHYANGHLRMAFVSQWRPTSFLVYDVCLRRGQHTNLVKPRAKNILCALFTSRVFYYLYEHRQKLIDNIPLITQRQTRPRTPWHMLQLMIAPRFLVP